MLGPAAVAMWWDATPEIRSEIEDWHTHEHMPERLRIPGFLRGTRWAALSGEPSYFIIYEVASLAVLTGRAYLERLNNPTPWSRKMMPHHLNMTRSLCEVRTSRGGGIPAVMGTIRFSPRAGETPALPRAEGLSAVHLLQAQANVPQTTELKIRGGDAAADWVLLAGGYDVEKVQAFVAKAGGVTGLYRPAYSLSAAEIA